MTTTPITHLEMSQRVRTISDTSIIDAPLVLSTISNSEKPSPAEPMYFDRQELELPLANSKGVASIINSTPRKLIDQPEAPQRRRRAYTDLPTTPPPFSRYIQQPSSPTEMAVATNTAAPIQASTNTSVHSGRSHRRILSTPSVSSIPHEFPPSPTLSGAVHVHGRSSMQLTDSFRERRHRAEKLTRFFGVTYADLYPETVEVFVTPPSSRAGLRLPSRHKSTSAKTHQSASNCGNGYERISLPHLPLKGVSVTVQQVTKLDEEDTVGANIARGLSCKSTMSKKAAVNRSRTDMELERKFDGRVDVKADDA